MVTAYPTAHAHAAMGSCTHKSDSTCTVNSNSKCSGHINKNATATPAKCNNTCTMASTVTRATTVLKKTCNNHNIQGNKNAGALAKDTCTHDGNIRCKGHDLCNILLVWLSCVQQQQLSAAAAHMAATAPAAAFPTHASSPMQQYT